MTVYTPPHRDRLPKLSSTEVLSSDDRYQVRWRQESLNTNHINQIQTIAFRNPCTSTPEVQSILADLIVIPPTLDRNLRQDVLNLRELCVREHNVARGDVLQVALLVSGNRRQPLGLQSTVGVKQEGGATYEEPGMGTTCGPREVTHASASWAGVTPFLCAIALTESTRAMLCLKTSSWKRVKWRRMSFAIQESEM